MRRFVFFSIILILASLILVGCKKVSPGTSESQKSEGTKVVGDFNFINPKKSAHYESNTPAHGMVLAGVPINVVVDFNFDLAKGSEISIVKDGREYGVGDAIIDSNKLAMRRNMDSVAPDGVYTVNYKACWPDGSCHGGSFQFAIDRLKSSGFEDLTGKSEVMVRLSGIAFNPQNIRVGSGTTITWINDDEVEHYVNTDSHPAHTYLPFWNSKALKKGDAYSVTLEGTGIYPYHCSFHASSMVGAILVE